MSEPIENIEWVSVDELWANDWNPNVVFTPELKLLEESLLSTGWIQPIIVNRNLMIIDGFHRTMLSREAEAIRARWKGLVPVVKLDIDDPDAMMMTVRINRAKGTHVAVRLSGLVQRLIVEHGKTTEDLVKGMGMTKSEVRLLADGSLLKSRNLDKYQYSKAWKPVETRHLSEEALAMLNDVEAYERDESDVE